jgi:hypothetical protein
MERKKIHIILATLLLFQSSLQAQSKETEFVEQLWLAYFNNTRITDKWGALTDIHLRTRDDLVKGLSIGIVRLGIAYHLNDHTRLILGYSYVHSFPAAPHTNVARPEHRPWQMIQWTTPFRSYQMVQNLRLEQRFRRKILNEDALAEGYNFNYRIRYNLLFQVPLGKKRSQAGSLSYLINDEIQINLGKEIVYNYFDQNRFFTGLNLQLNKYSHLQFGYTNVFVQLVAGNRYRDIHGIRLYFIQNMDLRKGK